VRVPEPTRVRALEAAGVIDRYVAIANPAALGLGLSVFISISLKSQSKEALAEFERRIVEHAWCRQRRFAHARDCQLFERHCAHRRYVAKQWCAQRGQRHV
jgi:DNA-binding Lrp family transcriptional regulator